MKKLCALLLISLSAVAGKPAKPISKKACHNSFITFYCLHCNSSVQDIDKAFHLENTHCICTSYFLTFPTSREVRSHLMHKHFGIGDLKPMAKAPKKTRNKSPLVRTYITRSALRKLESTLKEVAR